jgi:phenylacetyl-CoA:acceptor oxidoreductase subunit 2
MTIERIAPWKQTAWDGRAAGNFIGGGTGTGLALCAGAASLAGFGVPREACMAAALFVTAGLGCVALEIGRPERFFRVFLHARTSWMSREAIVAPILLASLIAAAAFGRSELAALAGVLAAVMLYCQARMLETSKGIPAWREPRIVPLIVTTGLAEGAGAFAALAALSNVTPLFALALLLALVVARAFAWNSYRERFTHRPAPLGTRAALAQLERPLLVLGTLLPALLAVAALAVSARFSSPAYGTLLAAAAGACAIAGGWLLKFVLVTRAGFTQAFALPNFPVRGAGAGGPGARPGWS